MGRVSKINYLHLLRETIDVLSQVQIYLDKEKQDSSYVAEAIKSLQQGVRHGGTKALKNASEVYRKKVEEEIQRKKWLEQQKQLERQAQLEQQRQLEQAQEQPINEEGSSEVQ